MSETSQKIVDEKPRFWEHKLFAQVLREEVQNRSELREKHRKTLPVFPKIPTEKADFPRLVRERMERQANLVKEADEVQRFLASAAFGESGQGRDEFFMIGLAEDLGRIYEECLDWSLWWRRQLLPGIYQPFLHEASVYSEKYLESIETLPDRLNSQIEALQDAPYNQMKVLKIELDMTPHNSDEFNEESEKLIRRIQRGLG